MFLPKRKCNYVLFYTYCLLCDYVFAYAYSLLFAYMLFAYILIVCLWYLKLFLIPLFHEILRMICFINCKFGSINFYKQRKWPSKYRHLGIAL